MFNIKYDETMELNQGDICNFALSFSDYKLDKGDELIFVVKNNDDTLFKKDVYKIIDGVAHFKIDNTDTENIPIGIYKYYLAIKPINMQGFNIISCRDFILERGVINEL